MALYYISFAMYIDFVAPQDPNASAIPHFWGCYKAWRELRREKAQGVASFFEAFRRFTNIWDLCLQLLIFGI